MKFFDRVRMNTSTTGTGTLTLTTATSAAYFTLAEAGAVDGDETYFLIEDGGSIEITRGIVGGSGTTITRATVQRSKIAGVAGTDKIPLGAGAIVTFVDPAPWLNDLEARVGTLARADEVVYAVDHTVTVDEAGKVLVANKATAIIFTLPPVASGTAETYRFRNIGAGLLTIDGNAAELVEGLAGIGLSTGMSAEVWLVDGNTAWRAAIRQPPMVTVDNVVPRFDQIAGRLQPSNMVIDDSGNVTGIANFTTSGNLNVTGTSTLTGSVAINGAQLTHTYTDNGTAGPNYVTIFESASPAANDRVWQHLADGRNSAGTLVAWGIARWNITDPTAGSEDSTYELYNYVAGVTTLNFTITPTGVQIPRLGDTTRGTGKFTTLGANQTVTFSAGGSMTGTWSDLGTVSQIDINGGTADALTLGGAVPAPATVTTLQHTGVLTSPHSLANHGRLTLESGVPASVSDQLAATNLYFTPYLGNAISLYTGSAWKTMTFSEITLALTLTSGKPYDVFAYDNAGTVALEILVWTNDTTRATALVRQDGVLCKTGALTRRYLGTLYASATNQCEDSRKKRFLWNMNNRVSRPCASPIEPTDTWSYTTATIRQANANAANQFEMVRGLDEDLVEAMLNAVAANNTIAAILNVGIGLDSTTAFAPYPDGMPGTIRTDGVTVAYTSVWARYSGLPGIGRHTLTWLEISDAIGTTTWAGDLGTPLRHQSGLIGTVRA